MSAVNEIQVGIAFQILRYGRAGVAFYQHDPGMSGVQSPLYHVLYPHALAQFGAQVIGGLCLEQVKTLVQDVTHWPVLCRLLDHPQGGIAFPCADLHNTARVDLVYDVQQLRIP